MTTETASPVTILNSIKGTELEINVVLTEADFEIGELVKLSPGSVLMFETKVGSPAVARVNGKSFAQGEIVQVGDKYGLKVAELMD